MDATLRDIQAVEEIYLIVDLLASEYGWTVEYIQALTLPEVYGLIRQILRRKGIKVDVPRTVKPEDTMQNLLGLARSLGVKSDKLKLLQEGKGITI